MVNDITGKNGTTAVLPTCSRTKVNDITGKNGATAVLPTCSRTMVNDITGENGATAVLPTGSRTRTRNYETLVRRQKYEDSIKVIRLSTF